MLRRTHAYDAALRERCDSSLTSSRARRDWARRLRRRRLRGRGGALSLAAILLCVAVGGAGIAAGQSSDGTLRKGDEGAAVEQLQRKLKIMVDGEFGPGTERALKRFQGSRRLPASGVADRATLRALGLAPAGRARRGSAGGAPAEPVAPDPATQPPGTAPVAVPAELQRVAQCESGGNPRAVSRDGQYRGKYQFLRSTWRGLGGRGDPARAPEWLQDKLALQLYQRSGTAPWGACA